MWPIGSSNVVKNWQEETIVMPLMKVMYLMESVTLYSAMFKKPYRGIPRCYYQYGRLTDIQYI